MQKFSNYIVAFVILYCGLLSLYRVFISSNNLTRIDEKVLAKRIEVVSTYKGSNRYGLTFEVDNYKEKLGIYVGSNAQSSERKIFNTVDTNNIYTFLLDPTILTDDGINLGLREIRLNGVNIYKESQNFNLYIGIFSTLGAVALFIIMIKFKKTKNAS